MLRIPNSRGIHDVLERLARGELHGFRCRNGDGLARRRIATHAFGAGAGGEAIDAILEAVTAAVTRGDTVQLIGASDPVATPCRRGLAKLGKYG